MGAKECPVCSKEKQKGKHLVCRECFQEYTEIASDTLAKGGEVIHIVAWAAEKIAARVPDLETGLELLRDQYCSLRGKVKEEALSFVRKSLNGKKVPLEVFNGAVEKKGKELWGDNGGNKLHFQVKSLENRIDFLKALLGELETKKG